METASSVPVRQRHIQGSGPGAFDSSRRRRDRPADSVPLRVLVVDDSLLGRLVVARALQEMGVSVDQVEDGSKAVDAIRDRSFDAVLMDCFMPEMDGFEATRTIRELEQGRKHIPIIALTGDDRQSDAQRCFDAGMDDFLTKPVGRDLLTTVLGRFCDLVPVPLG